MRQAWSARHLCLLPKCLSCTPHPHYACRPCPYVLVLLASLLLSATTRTGALRKWLSNNNVFFENKRFPSILQMNQEHWWMYMFVWWGAQLAPAIQTSVDIMTFQSCACISVSFQPITFKLGNFTFFKGFFSAEFSLTCPMQSKVKKKTVFCDTRGMIWNRQSQAVELWMI